MSIPTIREIKASNNIMARTFFCLTYSDPSPLLFKSWRGGGKKTVLHHRLNEHRYLHQDGPSVSETLAAAIAISPARNPMLAR